MEMDWSRKLQSSHKFMLPTILGVLHPTSDPQNGKIFLGFSPSLLPFKF